MSSFPVDDTTLVHEDVEAPGGTTSHTPKKKRPTAASTNGTSTSTPGQHKTVGMQAVRETLEKPGNFIDNYWYIAPVTEV